MDESGNGGMGNEVNDAAVAEVAGEPVDEAVSAEVVDETTSVEAVGGQGAGEMMNGQQTGEQVVSEGMVTEPIVAPVDGATPKQPKKQSKTMMILVIVLAVLLAVAGVVIAVLVANGNQGTGDSSGQDSEQASAQEDTYEPSGIEVTALDVNSDLVQGLMKPFLVSYIIVELDGGADNMYTDGGMLRGEPSDIMMLDLAIRNMSLTACRMPKNPYNLWQRYNELLTEWGGYYSSLDEEGRQKEFEQLYDNGCYDVTRARELIRKVFGKEITLEEKIDGPHLFYGYSADYDELFVATAGRGGVYPTYRHILNRAEQIGGDTINVYESEAREFIGELYEDCEESEELSDCKVYAKVYDSEAEYDGSVDLDKKVLQYFEKHKDEFPEYRWTFKKNEEGNYVFAGLKRVK